MVLVLSSRGFTLTDPARDTITVQSFLTTSENGFAVVDEETQTQGTYVVGAVATEETDGGDTARLTVYGSSSLIDASLTESFSNLDNLDLFLASATTGFEDVSSISIEPVSLSVPTNTITTGGIWGPAVHPGDSCGAADLRLCPLDAPPETVTKEQTIHESNTKKASLPFWGGSWRPW